MGEPNYEIRQRNMRLEPSFEVGTVITLSHTHGNIYQL
jgi:hypothetical protein